MTSEKKKKKFYDYSLLFIIIFLIAFGLVMIYSSSSYTAQLKFGNAAYFLTRQGAIAGAGIVCMIIISLMDYHIFLKFAPFLYILSYVLMIATMMVGKVINGKRRWLELGPLSFQPTEVVKIALIIFLAVLITNMGKNINSWRGILLAFAFDLPIAILVAMNNLSSGIIIIGLAVVITFVASNKKIPYLIGIVAVLLLLIFIEPLANLFHNIGLLQTYQYNRIMVWLDPAAHPLDGGYQVLQGLYAIGSGGLTGKGLGGSVQKLGFVPEAQNDMIFAIICEEFGFFGAISLILVFLFLIYRLIVIANSAPDQYGSLICVGVMAHIAIQVILNIAVVSNVIPNTGITLPFISYGGTSVFLLLCEMGMALSVAHSIVLER